MRKFSAATGGVFTAGSLSVSPLLTSVAPPAARRYSRVSSPWTGMMRILAAAGVDLRCRGRAGGGSHFGAAAGFLPVQENAHHPVFPVHDRVPGKLPDGGSFSVPSFVSCLLPFIGIIGMPVLCVTEYHLYRRMFLWKAEKYDFRGMKQEPPSGNACPAPCAENHGVRGCWGFRAAYRFRQPTLWRAAAGNGE